MKRTLTITGEVARKAICRHVMTADEGYIVTIGPQVKRRIQEEKYHAMIGDIADQCKFMQRTWSKEEWKRLLIDAYVRVARENAKAEGKPDPFSGHGEVVPSLEGNGFVQLGIQSRGFSIKQAAEFIEYLFAYGSKESVIFGDERQAA